MASIMKRGDSYSVRYKYKDHSGKPCVEWDLIHKIPLPRDAPKVNIEERTIWDEKTMLAALQTIEIQITRLQAENFALTERKDHAESQ